MVKTPVSSMPGSNNSSISSDDAGKIQMMVQRKVTSKRALFARQSTFSRSGIYNKFSKEPEKKGPKFIKTSRPLHQLPKFK
mgnify:CR=1 FL=1